MEFSVSTAENGDRKVVTASGELDAHSAPTLQAQVDPLTAVTGASVVIDLSNVGFIDSTGLGVLVATLKHVREVNGRLDVVVSSPRVLKVFHLTGLDAVIPLHATLDEALSTG
jgi:anti-sigma B factor antagonist